MTTHSSHPSHNASFVHLFKRSLGTGTSDTSHHDIKMDQIIHDAVEQLRSRHTQINSIQRLLERYQTDQKQLTSLLYQLIPSKTTQTTSLDTNKTPIPITTSDYEQLEHLYESLNTELTKRSNSLADLDYYTTKLEKLQHSSLQTDEAYAMKLRRNHAKYETSHSLYTSCNQHLVNQMNKLWIKQNEIIQIFIKYLLQQETKQFNNLQPLINTLTNDQQYQQTITTPLLPHDFGTIPEIHQQTFNNIKEPIGDINKLDNTTKINNSKTNDSFVKTDSVSRSDNMKQNDKSVLPLKDETAVSGNINSIEKHEYNDKINYPKQQQQQQTTTKDQTNTNKHENNNKVIGGQLVADEIAYEEKLKWSTQQFVTSKIKVKKSFQTEMVTLTIPVRKEYVDINEETVTIPTSMNKDNNTLSSSSRSTTTTTNSSSQSNDTFNKLFDKTQSENEDIEIVLTQEVPRVVMDVVPYERVRVRKVIEHSEETIHQTLRKDHIVASVHKNNTRNTKTISPKQKKSIKA